MRLSATVTEAELRALASSLVPLRINLEPGDDPEASARWLYIDELIDTSLEPDEGLVVGAKAAIRWPERALFDEFRVERIELLVAPRLVPTAKGVGLAITVRCLDLDVRWIPDFIDEAIVRRINARLAEAGVEFRWDFSTTLSVSFSDTSARSNVESIGFDVSTAQLEIDSGMVCISGPMQIRITRREPRELEREPAIALPAADE